ncbi:MAG: hypothetical protein GXO39_00275 [Thermotogae bacterium]|nr:hypothetical protein [Thermotogota bacterium]
MRIEDIERISREEYDYYNRIYRSFTKEDMPILSPQEIVEKCIVAAQEELVKAKGDAVLKSYAISVAARVLEEILKRRV